MLRQATGDSVQVAVTIATETVAEATAAQAELKTAISNDVYPSRLTTGGAYPSSVPPDISVCVTTHCICSTRL